MDVWDAQTYGSRWHEIYDGLPWPEPTAAVDFLAKLAADGPALELAIGTGRVAIPLVQRGVEVHGLDTSPEMVAQLRAKDGGADIPVRTADIAAFTVEGEYALAFLVLNTLYALQTQEEQLSCFRSVAAALCPGGHFVVEAFMPDPTRFRRNSWTQVHQVGLDHVLIEADQHDPSTQRILEQHIHFRQGKAELFPAFLRYTWPSEMDLMARLAGLEPIERFGGWAGEPFTAQSGNVVSVFRRPES
ncbi:class I SAM-dependent methyltransferase [Dactylosporangium sp. NBC_01737]|uniref:class I SAM-dependent DNA methyltransferase n=1 Tax=Dactylosporangium sp. NBC_01737 TaxID=2975959 RepID=UPI002E0E5382|nr:class I SAM-dependent methyltransferase [Dactylosporangium sp. NBC_01737]